MTCKRCGTYVTVAYARMITYFMDFAYGLAAGWLTVA